MVSGIVAFLAFLPLEPVWSAYTYPYLWGPVLADAAGHDVDGIHAGYSPVSTLTYGVLMVCALLLVHRALRRGGIPIDVFHQTGNPPADLWIPDQGVEPYRGRG